MLYKDYNYEPYRKTIKEFIKDKNKKDMVIPFIPVQIYIDIFKELGDNDVIFEQNGFQVDFWIYTTIDNEEFVLSGCLWWGNWTFSIKED